VSPFLGQLVTPSSADKAREASLVSGAHNRGQKLRLLEEHEGKKAEMIGEGELALECECHLDRALPSNQQEGQGHLDRDRKQSQYLLAGLIPGQ
jgi:hypothetical protein